MRQALIYIAITAAGMLGGAAGMAVLAPDQKAEAPAAKSCANWRQSGSQTYCTRWE